MTWKAWPINASSGAPSYDASAFRQLEAVWNTPHPSGSSRPLGAYSGRTPFSWLVTLSGLTVNIAAGAGVLDVEAAATNGAYRVVSDATDSTLALTAQGGTARIDGVYIQVDDTDIDSSTFRKALPAYVAGTPGSGVPPTSPPARSMRIATVNVPISGGGSPSVVMESLYTVALGGTLPVANSAAYPATPYPGQMVYDIALGYNVQWNGSLWRPDGPLGLLAVANSPGHSGQQSLIVVASFTANLVSGRKYRVSGVFDGAKHTTGAMFAQFAGTTGVPTNYLVNGIYSDGIGIIGSGSVVMTAPSTGAFSFQITANCQSGGTFDDSTRTQISVDDIGS